MNVQSRNCCWSNKCSKPSTRYTKECEQGRHNRSQRKKHHITISTKAQRSSPRVRPLVEIQILHFLLLFFLIFFWFCINYTNFQLNWTEGVDYRNSTIFSAKFKAPSRLWVRCLRSRIWASSDRQTWLHAKFDSTQFQKKYLNQSSYAKVMTVLPKHVRVTVLEDRIWLGIEIG
jgi:hypothetical protein